MYWNPKLICLFQIATRNIDETIGLRGRLFGKPIGMLERDVIAREPVLMLDLIVLGLPMGIEVDTQEVETSVNW